MINEPARAIGWYTHVVSAGAPARAATEVDRARCDALGSQVGPRVDHGPFRSRHVTKDLGSGSVAGVDAVCDGDYLNS